MRTITCRKCGATIDAALGECPNCGTVYYILPDESGKTDAPAGGNDGGFVPTSEFDVSRADSSEIFNTGVWKTYSDPDETRSFRPAPAPERQEPPPQRRRAGGEYVSREDYRRDYERRDDYRRDSERREDYRRDYDDRGGYRGDYDDRGDYRGGEQKRGKKPSKAKLFIIAAVSLIAVLTLVISLMSGAFDFDKNNEKMTMPNVLNYSEVSAVALLQSMGLEVEIHNQHASASEGIVVNQSIKADKVVKEGDKVILTVSLGPAEDTTDKLEEVSVPNLVGKTYDQALYLLGNVGLLARLGEEQYSDIPAGSVVSQNPEKGTIIHSGDMVLIILSKGPAPSPSPVSFTIAVTAGSGGTVNPKGLISVQENGKATFTFTPNEGYEVREIKVDGVSVTVGNSYTFDNVTKNHTLYVVFGAKAAPSPSPTPTPTPTPSPTPPADESLPAE